MKSICGYYYFWKRKKHWGCALDLIENNLRTKHGLTAFRADQCVSKMEMDSTCKLRRGIHYRFLRILDITDKKKTQGWGQMPFRAYIPTYKKKRKKGDGFAP